MKSFLLRILPIFLFAFLSFQVAEACQHTKTQNLGYSPYCEGDQVTFTNNLNSGCFDPTTEYCLWRVEKKIGFNYQTISTHQQNNIANFVHTFNSGGKYRVSFTVNNISDDQPNRFPCNNTCKAEIEVYDGPNSAISTLSSFNCANNEVSIDVNAGNQYSVVTIDWGDGNTSSYNPTGNSFTHTYNNPLQSSYTVQVTVQVFIGCHPGTYTSSQVVNLLPNILWLSGPATCDGQTVCYTSEVAGVDYFQWFAPNGEPVSGPMTSGCVTLTSSGTYSIQIITSDGCVVYEDYPVSIPAPNNPGVLYINAYNVTPGDVLNLNSGGNPSGDWIAYEILYNDCFGSPQWYPFQWGPLSSLSTFNVPGYVTDNWMPCMLNDDFEFCFRIRVFCENPLTNGQNYYSTPSSLTNEVCVPICVVNDPCPGGGGNGTDLVEIPEDVQTVRHTSLSLFPNPAKDLVRLELRQEEPIEGLISVQVFNTNGQALMDYEFNTDGNGIEEEIDLSNLPSGVYLVKAIGENLSASQFIIRQ